jgi:phosphate transport system substrate-binding protein
MRRLFFIWACLWWAWPVAAAALEPRAPLKVGGAGAAMSTMSLLATAFIKENPDQAVKIVLPSLGSNGGIKALLAGAIDIAVTARPLAQAERDKGIAAQAYGKSAVVFAVVYSVGQAIPQRNLTAEDLVEIYSGTRTNWPDGRKIRLVLRPAFEADNELIRNHIPGMASALTAAERLPAVPIVYSDQEAADAIERIPGAVGATSLNLILAERRPFHVLRLNGVLATAQNIHDGTYPMTKIYYFVTREHKDERVQQFLDFVRSPQGRRILQRSGHIVSGVEDQE